MNKKIADLEFGKEGEIRTQKLLESLFGPLEDQNETDENSLFDFKNDHVYVEVKRRRVTKAKYPDTMVGENKVIEGFNLQTAGYRVFFAFQVHLSQSPARGTALCPSLILGICAAPPPH
jgi:hypothetical protein